MKELVVEDKFLDQAQIIISGRCELHDSFKTYQIEIENNVEL